MVPSTCYFLKTLRVRARKGEPLVFQAAAPRPSTQQCGESKSKWIKAASCLQAPHLSLPLA